MRPYEVWFAYCFRKVCRLSVTLVNSGQTVTDRPMLTMGTNRRPEVLAQMGALQIE
jgi:hypothetical protein